MRLLDRAHLALARRTAERDKALVTWKQHRREAIANEASVVLETRISPDAIDDDWNFAIDGISFYASAWVSWDGASGWYIYVRTARAGAQRVHSLADLPDIEKLYGLDLSSEVRRLTPDAIEVLAREVRRRP